MIVLRSKSFSKNISKEEMEKNKKRAEIALGAVKVTPGAAAGLLIGEGIKKGIDSKLEKDAINLILSGADVTESLKDHVDNLKNNPNKLNFLDREALDSSDQWRKKLNRHTKLDKFSKNKIFRYGLPVTMAVAGGYANKVAVDSVANRVLKRKSKKKKDDSIKE